MYSEYHIVQSSNHYEFVKRITSELKEGWQLIGGVSVVCGKIDADGEASDNGKYEFIFNQAMTR